MVTVTLSLDVDFKHSLRSSTRRRDIYVKGKTSGFAIGDLQYGSTVALPLVYKTEIF